MKTAKFNKGVKKFIEDFFVKNYKELSCWEFKKTGENGVLLICVHFNNINFRTTVLTVLRAIYPSNSFHYKGSNSLYFYINTNVA